MAEKMIAYCGILCNGCPSMVATLANDHEELEKVAVMAREQWGLADATWETVQCTGCKGSGVRIAYCNECGVSVCASQKGVETCAHCEQFEGCVTLEVLFEQFPDCKQVLAEIRATLN
jgi:hypothetical protein